MQYEGEIEARALFKWASSLRSRADSDMEPLKAALTLSRDRVPRKSWRQFVTSLVVSLTTVIGCFGTMLFLYAMGSLWKDISAQRAQDKVLCVLCVCMRRAKLWYVYVHAARNAGMYVSVVCVHTATKGKVPTSRGPDMLKLTNSSPCTLHPVC